MVLRAVGHWASAEAMTLLITGEATTHGVAADVHLLACFEITHGDGSAKFETLQVVDAIFTQVAEHPFAGFGEVALGGLVDQLFASIAKADLDGLVAVSFGGFELGDPARPRLDQGDRDGFALLIEELGHTQFLPKDADGHGR